jgi:hypothetical protein
MQKFRLSGVLVSLTLLTFSACAQPALAQENHRWHKQLVSRRNFDANAAHPSAAPTANLYSLQAAFVQDYPTIGANSDGSDLWPCLQSYQGGNGSNSDCATLGNPSIPTPTIAAVLGIPAYVWPLNNTNGVGNGFGCDALVNGTSGLSESQYIPCGQFETWYEDDTNDSTDDLLQRIVVRQGSTVIYDSGIVDFGPAGPTVKYPVDVILASDSNFGFWSGASVGPNNGNCTADISYPLTSPANPGGLYIVADNATCKEPVTGLATVTTTTALATPSYTKVTGTVCTSKGVPSPCYVVKWKEQYEIAQDWKLFFD